MRAYLVRITETKEFVGVFVTGSRRGLGLLVDEVTCAAACEAAPLPAGGVYQPGHAGMVPVMVDFNGDVLDGAPVFERSDCQHTELTESWRTAFTVADDEHSRLRWSRIPDVVCGCE